MCHKKLFGVIVVEFCCGARYFAGATLFVGASNKPTREYIVVSLRAQAVDFKSVEF